MKPFFLLYSSELVRMKISRNIASVAVRILELLDCGQKNIDSITFRTYNRQKY